MGGTRRGIRAAGKNPANSRHYPTAAHSSKGGVHSTSMHAESYKVPTMKKITESVAYPYSVSLPIQFRAFLESVGMDYYDIGSTVVVKFETKQSLTEGIRVLKKSKHEKATIIMNGIGRSI